MTQEINKQWNFFSWFRLNEFYNELGDGNVHLQAVHKNAAKVNSKENDNSYPFYSQRNNSNFNIP